MSRKRNTFTLHVSENGELFLLFTIAFILTLFSPILFPHLKLLYFIPFIVRLFYVKTYATTLLFSCLCGLILDLFSAHVRFGIHAVSYSLSSALLYSQRRNFFEDSLSTLPGLTFLYSIVNSVIQLLFLIIFEKGVTISPEFVMIDLLLLPFLDALYAFIFVSIPKLIFGKPIKKGKDYFY
ncbi:Uncharacterized protein PHSC3_001767 [Chlamydiales bacterium STE3]|nr:Uncharacterized protein PHSC3_001767 [Chlamydiales bacterium STE3]